MTTANINVRQILIKRGNTEVSSAYTGPLGELTLDTDLDTVRVHNGVTAGGVNLLATQTQIDTLTAAIDTITGTDSGLADLLDSQQTQITNIISGITTFGNVVPDVDSTYNLGSTDLAWNEVHVSNTVYIGGTPMTITEGVLTVNGNTVTGGGTGGSYNDLTDLPTLVTSYNQLTDLPVLVTSYNDLTDLPTLVTSYNNLQDLPTLVTSYNDLTDLPTLPDSILDLGITDGATGTFLTTNGSGVFTFASTPAPSQMFNNDYTATLDNEGTFSLPGTLVTSLEPGSTNIDASGSAINLSNGASVSWINFSGMIVVNDQTSGGVYTWLVGGGGVVLLGNTLATTGTMEYNGGSNLYTFTNDSGSARDYAFATIRTRSAA